MAKGRSGSPRPVAPAMVTRKPRPIRKLAELIRSLPGYNPYDQAGDCTFDEKSARHAIKWIESNCSHCKGELARQPFLLEPWQRAIIACLFGWRRPDGTRRYRQAFLFLPRKNGKTALAAALICYMLFEDGEKGSEI